MVKRHSKSRTYDSAHVMPGAHFPPQHCEAQITDVWDSAGGNIDPVDLDSSAWTSLFPPTTSSSPAASSRLSSEALQALRLCAIRETLEETGLLLVESAHKGDQAALSAQQRWERLGAAEQTRWREEVHNDGRRFLDLLRELGEGIRPALSSLTHWSNWVHVLSACKSSWMLTPSPRQHSNPSRSPLRHPLLHLDPPASLFRLNRPRAHARVAHVE